MSKAHITGLLQSICFGLKSVFYCFDRNLSQIKHNLQNWKQIIKNGKFCEQFVIFFL